MALPNPVVWLPEGVSGRRMLCAVSMAVDRWGLMGMHSQVAGAGRLTCSAPGSHGIEEA